MAVVIRMKQMGRKHRPYYRICAANSRSPRDGKVIEEIGTYDPMIADTDARCTLNHERVAYWLGVGAKPSEKVHGRHPTQKPIALLDRVVAASAQPGDLVLDPFSGSGTTGVAAVRAGCRYLGLERDREYIDLAARRLRAVEGASIG